MRPKPDPTGPGQESVWAYPRPAIAEPTAARIVIEHAGTIVADTCASVRTLETSHPPSYYIPLCDIAPGVLRRADGSSLCEWQGAAVYWDVVIGDIVVPRVRVPGTGVPQTVYLLPITRLPFRELPYAMCNARTRHYNRGLPNPATVNIPLIPDSRSSRCCQSLTPPARDKKASGPIRARRLQRRARRAS